MAQAGERFGRYTLGRALPPRGPGEHWTATSDDAPDYEVAICITPLTRRDEAEAERQLLRNLEVARLIRHENMVHVLDGGHARGLRYVVTELVDGVELMRVLAAKRATNTWPSFGVSGFIVHEVARALEYLHAFRTPFGESLGLAHREVSPRSVIIERSGTIKLADMLSGGESQSLVETAGRQQSGLFAYVSPEIASNGRVDARSDIFALGALLWELLSRQALFLRTTDLETLAAVRSAEIPAAPSDCPPALMDIARRCLVKPPEQRPLASDLVRDLARIVISFTEAGPASAKLLFEGTLAFEANEAADTTRPKKRTSLLTGSGPNDAEREDAAEGPSSTRAERRHQTLRSDPPSAAAADADLQSSGFSGAAPDPFYDPTRDVQRWGNRFEVLERLGAGGMGEVYRVRDKELDEVVAIKLIPRESTTELRSTERLKREVRLARRISSPYVCRIYDIVDLGDGVRGLTMAFIDGTTLAEMMRAGLYVDYQRIARWGAEIAEGLSAAHDLQIIHRDLKPENVMIRADDRAVILDFGIAFSVDTSDLKLTQAGMIMGTPLYMSPEQLVNSQLDGRSDLFALGLILAELITGEVPMRGGTYAELLERRVTKIESYSIKDVDPGVPEALATVIDDLLHVAAADRPASAIDIALRLRTFLGRTSPGSSLDATPMPVLVSGQFRASEPPRASITPVELAPLAEGSSRPEPARADAATRVGSKPPQAATTPLPEVGLAPPQKSPSERPRRSASATIRAATIVLGSTAFVLLVLGIWVAYVRSNAIAKVIVQLDAGAEAEVVQGPATPDASTTPSVERVDAGPAPSPRDAGPKTQDYIAPAEEM